MTAPPQIELQRHLGEMSAKDENVVVQTLAELVITYLKQNPDATRRTCGRRNTPDVKLRAATGQRQKETQA